MRPDLDAASAKAWRARIRIGVIGGGAAAEGIHLPALARAAGVDVAAVVDPVEARIDASDAQPFGVRAGFSDYRDAIPHIDAAILGIPHQFSRAGRHRPAERRHPRPGREADGADDGRMRRDDSRRPSASGALLAVGLLRRFAPTLRWTKEALTSGLLGPITSFDIREGMVFRWPVKSAAMFSPSCGGVTGRHRRATYST